MRFVIDDREIEKLARQMLRETVERSGWYPNTRPRDRAERIERDVDQMWRVMAEAARERLEEGGA